MTCPCCAPSDTCSGSVTFTMSNFSSVALSNGSPYLGLDSPNGVYSGSLETSGNNSACSAFASGQQFTLGGTDTSADCRIPGSAPLQPGPYNIAITAFFVHPITGSCINPFGGVPSCGVRVDLTGRRGAPTFECASLSLTTKLAFRFTIAQLNDGISLSASDFNVFSPGNFLSFWTLTFDFFMQRNPLP